MGIASPSPSAPYNSPYQLGAVQGCGDRATLSVPIPSEGLSVMKDILADLPEPLLDELEDLDDLKEAAGSFYPILFRISISKEPDPNVRDDFLSYKGVEFHEFVHYFQAIGSTYCIHAFQDALECIWSFVDEAGGHSPLVLRGGSDILTCSMSVPEHLAFHARTLEGNYGSRSVALNSRDTSAGGVQINMETQCWEYVRWNRAAKCFFATPLGAASFMECAAYLSQRILVGTGGDIRIIPQFNAGPESRLHIYTAPLELYLNLFQDKPIQPVLASLLAILDLSLQIPSIHHRAHPDYPALSHPSMRFVSYTKALQNVRLLDPMDRQDYRRFVSELETALGWPSTFTVWQDYHRYFHERTAELDTYARASVKADPDKFEAYIRTRTRALLSRNLQIRGGIRTQDRGRAIEELTEIAGHIRNNPIAYLGILGGAVFIEIAKALELRTQAPEMLALPYAYPVELVDALTPPQCLIGDREVVRWSRMPMLEDLNGLKHLWALTLQWLSGRRSGLKCGNRKPGKGVNHKDDLRFPCPEVRFIGSCHTWPVHSDPAKCTFIDVIDYFNLRQRS